MTLRNLYFLKNDGKRYKKEIDYIYKFTTPLRIIAKEKNIRLDGFRFLERGAENDTRHLYAASNYPDPKRF